MKKILGALGLCRKAGKVTVGTRLVIEDMRSGKVKLAVATKDTAKNSLDKVKHSAEINGAELIICDIDKKELSAAIGLKREVGIVGITEDFKNIVINSL